MFFSACNQVHYCFHSTYEELKLLLLPPTVSPLLLFSFYLWGIETHDAEVFERDRFTFSFYLWGIETQNGGILKLIQIYVFILPMRNWNSLPGTEAQAPASQFSFYLWGIETLKSRLPLAISVSFSFYLWGIETIPCRSGVRFFFSVFILPMRNWNPVSGRIANSSAKCFHSTYEELKQLLPQHCNHILRCFHSTYEELKHAPANEPLWLTPPFSFYLWGIETVLMRCRISSGKSFSFYLWGIETGDSFRDTDRACHVFILPMRNWNSQGRCR